MDGMRLLLSLTLALFVLWRHLSGGLLFAWPGLMRSRKLSESEVADHQSFLDMVEPELKPLGYTLIGGHAEKPPLGRSIICFDYVNEQDRSWATVYRQRNEANLYFLTRFEDGAYVLTADHKRTGVERDDYLAGGLPDAKPEPLQAVHQRRVERMKSAGRIPAQDLSLDARVRAAEEWFKGHGVRETRAKNFVALILSLMGLYIIGSVLYLGFIKSPVTPSGDRTSGTGVQQEVVK